MAMPLTIFCFDDEPAVRLAGKELARCLRAMTGEAVRVRPVKAYTSTCPGIYVGMPEHFRAAAGKTVCRTHRWDDALVIQSMDESLLLTGANPRSVLFAAYRWLEELGARWVRPRRDGELLPKIPTPSLAGWSIREKAGNRHRGIVIEGACSIDDVLAMVDWMPKLRMNAYMLQFRVSATFWQRWYSREDLPSVKNPHLLSLEECAALDARVIEAVKARGLMLHRVGHSWTSQAVGNTAGGWDKEGPAPDDIRPLLAEVNGVRDWFTGIPLNTELCYGNPEARRRYVNEVLNYAANHPEVDVLHVWASDGMNNWCECPACAKFLPSDWYVSMLKEISPKLAEIAPQMRLVALCYTNTLWPPQHVSPADLRDNLIFMFAPIFRCYRHGILDKRCTSETPFTPFARNKARFAESNGDYAATFRAWQQYLPAGTDSFTFDYHFWLSCAKDFMGIDLTRVLRDDVRQYRSAGVNGLLSCQIQRTSMPTALAQIAMTKYLWAPKTTVDEVEDEYYPAAFGPAGELAREFIAAFTLACGSCEHIDTQWEDLVTRKHVRAVRRVLREYAPRVKQALATSEHPVWRLSLKLLLYFIRYQKVLWRAFALRAEGDPRAKAALEDAIAFLRRTEPRVYRWMDVDYWVMILKDDILAEWNREDEEEEELESV